MPLRADDDMVVDADAQPFAGLDDLAGDLDILLAGRRIARRMIVHHSKGSHKKLIFDDISTHRWELEPLIGVCLQCPIVIITLDHPVAR